MKGPETYSEDPGILPVLMRSRTLMLASSGSRAEELVSLTTRENVTQSYLLAHNKGETYRAVAILFPGGAGDIGLRQSADGVSFSSNNFLVRSRDKFVSGGVAAAVIDGPSDYNRMTDAFRMSRMHSTDVGAIIADLKKRFPDAKVYLVGTSRGTVSAAYAGLALGEQIGGVVLTSSVFNASKAGPGVSGVDYSSIKAPLLFVHHREDACNVCPYAGAQRLAGQFPLISVIGGLPPRSGPCEALSNHGYLGKEAETVAAITNWITGKPYEKDIR